MIPWIADVAIRNGIDEGIKRVDIPSLVKAAVKERVALLIEKQLAKKRDGALCATPRGEPTDGGDA